MSNYIKIGAAAFLFILGLVSLGIYGYDTINNFPPPPLLMMILGMAIAFALQALGLSQGIAFAKPKEE